MRQGPRLLDAQTRTHGGTKREDTWHMSGAWKSVDTEAGMLSGISRKRSIRSNPYWFTEFCNSQCLSHFAAPFIVVRAETSVAESCEEAFKLLDGKRQGKDSKMQNFYV